MNDTCKICGSERIRSKILYGYDMISCSRCGVHYMAGLFNDKEVNKYYENDYRITSKDKFDTEFRRIFRIPEQIELISIISRYVPPPARILDIGCDKAYFIDEARRHDYDCTGIELSAAAHEYASKVGIQLKKSFDELDKTYDVAVMWHSLEHIPEPYVLFENLKKNLNNDAYVFIRVPAFDSIWRKLLGKKWIWFQPRNHCFHYSHSSLKCLLEKAGFDVEFIEHRKPNNRHTKAMYRKTKSIFSTNFNYKTGIRKQLSRYYEDLSGVELFAVARLKIQG